MEELPASLRSFALPRPAGAIAKISYSHDAMIDLIIANPGINQDEIAKTFGYTPGWISQVIASDAFQSRLAARKNEIVDPLIRASVEERLKGLAHRSLEVLMRKLNSADAAISDELALGAAKIATTALGYGAKQAAVQNNVQFVVQVPPKSADPATWLKEHAPLASIQANGSSVGTPATRSLSSSGEVADAEVVATEARPAKPDAEALLKQLLEG